MKTTRFALATLALTLSTAQLHAAGIIILLTDRTTDSVWRLHDDNNNGVIEEPAELNRWFGPGNASGLPGVLNPNTIAYQKSTGLCLIGDQDVSARRVYWTRDLNNDGDAMDAGEAGIYADLSTGAGLSFAFPSGCGFDNTGVPVIINAGNGSGPDAVWRCPDLNNDGDANDPGETTSYTNQNGFSTSNGAFSPQEFVLDYANVIYLRNSSSTLHGIWRIHDDDASGMADSPAEFSGYYTDGNASGFTLGAGFAIDIDPARARSFYYHTLASGGIDQVYRVSDLNADGDAMDAGESVLVFSTGESGFTSIDVTALRDRSVFISDNSGKRIIRLSDITPNDLFEDAGERATFFGPSTTVGDVRNIAIVHDVGCSDADLGKQGGVIGGDDALDNNDFVVFIDLFFANAPLADVGRQGGLAGKDGQWDNNDFVAFIDLFFAGCDG